MAKLYRRTGKRKLGSPRLVRLLTAALPIAVAAVLVLPRVSVADEGGVSFWLPGQFGSLAAAPGAPGWALGLVNYYTSVGASGAVAAAREVTLGRFNGAVNVNLNATVKATPDLVFIAPSYTFATPVFGGQLAVGVTEAVGRSVTDLSGTLTLTGPGGGVINRQGSIDDGRNGFSDLYPLATLKWNSGVNNWMTYLTGDIPVGLYSTTNLANIGIGHGAIDGGVGYTYFNPQTGNEFSAVTGLTYNLVNPSTGYQNGIDWHLDWGASHFLTKTMFVGAVGYAYDQVTADSGCLPALCPFESRVFAAGPQVGFIFPGASFQTYLNFKAYGEFDAANRPSGWNAWVTLAFSPSPPTPAGAPPSMLTKAPPR
jgi:hypothetical protein